MKLQLTRVLRLIALLPDEVLHAKKQHLVVWEDFGERVN